MQKTGVSLNSEVDWRFYDGPVDIESELRNLSRPASRCPTRKYLPKCSQCECRYQGKPCGSNLSHLCNDCKNGNIKDGKNCGDKNLVDFPDSYFPVEYTRLTDSVPRGVGINRFEYPCIDPQANLFFQGEKQVLTRTVVKDNYKPVKCLPKINSMDPH